MTDTTDKRPEYDDLSKIPLTPHIARRFVLNLFAQKPQWTRQELAAEVERAHKQRKGIPGAQHPVLIVKKVLGGLREEGAVINVSKGIWRRVEPGAAPVSLPDAPAEALDARAEVAAPETEEEDLVVIESIGDGPESVYGYYNPNDRELAQLKGTDSWECKIGRTQGNAVGRVVSQGAKTALSHEPIVGLVIRTDNAALVEKALHASLRLADREVLDSPGTEWFRTSPSKIKQWYQVFLEGLKSLSAGGPTE